MLPLIINIITQVNTHEIPHENILVVSLRVKFLSIQKLLILYFHDNIAENKFKISWAFIISVQF